MAAIVPTAEAHAGPASPDRRAPPPAARATAAEGAVSWVARLAFTLSGACGLVFELVWSRQLAPVLGVTAQAIAAVLTAFMAGLALGSWLGARVAGRLRTRPSALAVYGLLELGIGLSTLCVAPALGQLTPLYRALASRGGPLLDVPGLLPILFALLLFLLPATLMGATLPVLGEAVHGRGRKAERSIGLLYALNTAGAVLGTAGAGLLLLPALGLRQTSLCASALNLGLGLTVLLAARLEARRQTSPTQAATGTSPALPAHAQPAGTAPPRAAAEQLAPPAARAAAASSAGEAGLPRPVLAEPPAPPGVQLAIALAVLCGSATAMAYQVLWTRALAIVLGSSTYSFTLILTAYLLGLAGGSALASHALPRLARPVLAQGVARLLVAVAAAPCLLFLDRLPELVLGFFRSAEPDPALLLSFTFLLALAVVVLPTLAMGASLPLALASFRRDAVLGRRVGSLYAASTLGAIAGSASAGFLLLPGLGLRWGITAAVLGDLLLALLLFLLAGRLRPGRAARGLAAVCLAGLLLVPLAVPGWNTSVLTAGMYRISLVKRSYQTEPYVGGEQLLYRDGVATTVSVERRGKTLLLKANGKVEASSRADMPTQVLAALVPLLLHPAPQDVLLVGLASGVTAGAALQADIRSLTVVELEPAMVEASRLFAEVNHRPLDDPRTRLVLGDGRNVLAVGDRRFDVIISEPSNPWIAGVASLFTAEAFTTARARLAPGGIFCQWLQLYEISEENIRLVLRTFSRAFPHTLAFATMERGVDLLLIGSDRPIDISLPLLAGRLARPRLTAEAGRADVAHVHDLLALLLAGTPQLAELAGPGPSSTDDLAQLEFSAPLDLMSYDRHEDGADALHRRARELTQVAELVQGAGPADLAELAAALLRVGDRDEALRLARPLAPAFPRAARVLLLAELAGEDLRSLALPGDARLPRTIDGARATEMASFWRELERGRAEEALEVLGRLDVRSGLDPAYAVLAAYTFLRDGMSSSAVEVLTDLAGRRGGPVAGYLLGRALIARQRYREGFRWLEWSVDAGLPLPPFKLP